MQVTQERITSYSNALCSPVEQAGSLYLVASNGEILSHGQKTKSEFRLGGQPSSIAIERDQSTVYIADMAHQAVMMRQLQEGTCEVLVKEYEGMPLLGPNSIICSSSMNSIFFTDSGPFGESSLECPKGSVFMVDLDGNEIKPLGLAVQCLAHPCGLALSKDEKILFVAETCNNRILRFVLTNSGVYFFSIYHQFNGRFGPTAITVSSTDLLYVARMEFSFISDMGIISVINNQGQIAENISLPGAPEITGMCFSQIKTTCLYFTENTNGNKLMRIYIPLEDKDEDKKKKEKDYKLK